MTRLIEAKAWALALCWHPAFVEIRNRPTKSGEVSPMVVFVWCNAEMCANF
jgi:hypothetical protein